MQLLILKEQKQMKKNNLKSGIKFDNKKNVYIVDRRYRNVRIGTNYDTNGEKFQNYYKDVSKNMKEKKLDLLIVVNMFLTGFDAYDDISKEWSEFVRQKAVEQLNEIIAAHNLKSEETFSLIEFSLKNETMSFNGTKLDAIIPPISIFGGRAKKKQLLLERLPEYYDKYSGIVIFLRGDNYAQTKKRKCNIKY